MPEPLVHFAIPFASIVIARLGYRKALLTSFFAVLPDIDALLRIHQSPTHSVLLLAIPLLTAIIFAPKYKTQLTFILIGLSSHIFLDLFQWYTPVLWPLIDQSIYITIELRAQIASNFQLLPDFKILTQPTIMGTSTAITGPIFTSTGFAITILLMIPILIDLSLEYRAWSSKRRSLRNNKR